MKKLFIIAAVIIGFNIGSTSFAGHQKVGGYGQLHPNQVTENQIGAGWGHKSMTYGMMNLMSGMTTQAAKIIRSGKTSQEMNKRLAEILDHIAEMLNYAPAYMMGSKVVDSNMINLMQGMLKDLEKMRKEIGIK
ncbi:MAG: hypothetical protein U9R43_15625 [Thermodesulfobacteriota bacterium]|nr:hypothetical protein [Thermodesulfobacteriota bacterium]